MSFVKLNSIERKNRSWVKTVLEGNQVESIDTRCCFYDSEKQQCTIYPVRPKICHSFICSKSLSIIEREKGEAHKKAFFNGNNLKTLQILTCCFFVIIVR